MKSTYRLLNVELDGKKMYQNLVWMHDDEQVKNIDFLTADLKLLDFPVCVRKISGRRLLAAGGCKKVFDALRWLKICKKLVVILDYRSRSKIATKLYVRRVLQAMEIIHEEFPNIELNVAVF